MDCVIASNSYCNSLVGSKNSGPLACYGSCCFRGDGVRYCSLRGWASKLGRFSIITVFRRLGPRIQKVVIGVASVGSDCCTPYFSFG